MFGIIGKHIPRDRLEWRTDLMTVAKHQSGYMDRQLFLNWLRILDRELAQPSLLILDSCQAHRNFDNGDPETNQPWAHLRIERLPCNTTSVTQPLDQGIISVFKRKFLEMLGDQEIAASYGSNHHIMTGKAWSLIPFAWSHVKETTLRHCFREAGVLTTGQCNELHNLDISPPAFEEREVLWPPEKVNNEEKKSMYLQLIALSFNDDQFRFQRDTIQEDVQELAAKVVRKLRDEMATRRAVIEKREKSSSVEPQEVESFKTKKAIETIDIVAGLLNSNNPEFRRTARHIIREANAH